MSNPIFPSYAHTNKHAVSFGLGLGGGLVANQVFGASPLDAALIGGGIFLVSEALITLDEPTSVTFSAPGIAIAATPTENGNVRVTGTAVVRPEAAQIAIETLKTEAEAARPRSKKAS
jgi:hypothetical protein